MHKYCLLATANLHQTFGSSAPRMLRSKSFIQWSSRQRKSSVTTNYKQNRKLSIVRISPTSLLAYSLTSSTTSVVASPSPVLTPGLVHALTLPATKPLTCWTLPFTLSTRLCSYRTRSEVEKTCENLHQHIKCYVGISLGTNNLSKNDRSIPK